MGGPPNPPSLRSVPAKPCRSSRPRQLMGPRHGPPNPPAFGASRRSRAAPLDRASLWGPDMAPAHPPDVPEIGLDNNERSYYFIDHAEGRTDPRGDPGARAAPGHEGRVRGPHHRPARRRPRAVEERTVRPLQVEGKLAGPGARDCFPPFHRRGDQAGAIDAARRAALARAVRARARLG